MSEFSALVDVCKRKLQDVEEGHLPKFSLVQPKYDGWWTLLRIRHEMMQFITSGGEVRSEIRIPGCEDGLIIAEWIIGTNWSLLQKQTDIAGKAILHTVISIGGDEVSLPLDKNAEVLSDFCRRNLPENKFRMVESYPISQWRNVWEEFVDSKGFEGLVFKQGSLPYHSSALGRMKKKITIDYVVMGFTEGKNRLEGTLGAIEGGLFVDGKLKKVCTVGGGFSDFDRHSIWKNRANLIGKVFEATGKVLFDSGALRHPTFIRFRDDKKSGECIWLG